MYGNFLFYLYVKVGVMCFNKFVDWLYGFVIEYQFLLYFMEKDNGLFEFDLDVIVYILWIGINDNGVGGILMGDQMLGVMFVDIIICVVNWVKMFYMSGVRNFVFQNVCFLF